MKLNKPELNSLSRPSISDVDKGIQRDTLSNGDQLLELLNSIPVPALASRTNLPLPSPAPELLNKAQAAAMFAISVRTLDRLVAKNAVPHVRLGPRCVRFPRKALAAWLESRTQGMRN